MADIFLGVYRDNAALGQRVWPPQIDSASCLLLRVAFPRREQHGVASARVASRRLASPSLLLFIHLPWPHYVYRRIAINFVGDPLPM